MPRLVRIPQKQETDVTQTAPAAFTDRADIPHFIAGERRAATSGRSQAVFNPATGERIADVLADDADTVAHKAQRARVAQPRWSQVPQPYVSARRRLAR